MILLIFFLINWGLSNIICNEYIFIHIRDWFNKNIPFIGKLIGCVTCFGFYSSFFLYLLIQPIFLTNILLIDALLFGLAGSGLNNIIDLIKIKYK